MNNITETGLKSSVSNDCAIAHDGVTKISNEKVGNIVHRPWSVTAPAFFEMLTGSKFNEATLVAIHKDTKKVLSHRTRRGIGSSGAWVREHQKAGFNIYITANRTAGMKRRKTDILDGRAVWIDDDVIRPEPRKNWPVPPHMVVETSPGKFHYWWLTSYHRDAFDRAEALMKRMVSEHPGADPSVCDVSRVLRMPGTVNLKPGAGGHIARLVHTAEHGRYALDQLDEAWPVADSAVDQQFNKAIALETIRSGAPGMHDALRDLAAHEIASGRPPADVKAYLHGLLADSNDGSVRHRERDAEVDKLVDSARKFAPVLPTAEGFEDVPLEVVAATRGKAPETHHGYAMALLRNMKDEAGGHEPVGADGVVYTVDESGLYVSRTIDAIGVAVARKFDGQKKCERYSDYKAIATHLYVVCEQPGFFDAAPIGLACPDGFYRVTPEGQVDHEPLDAKHRQRHKHPASPKAGNKPQFDIYLAQTFAAATSSETGTQIAFIQEVAGAIALGLMADHEKVVLLYGPGRSGKGTMMKIFEALVPPDSRASVNPFKWDSEYYLAALAGKRLNVVGELPDDIPLPGAYFKTVTGRDLLSGRHPTHRPFTFRNEAAHVFNSNTYPNTRDHSEAFFTRWCIVGFPNSRITRGTIETDLAARIVREELAAILAWALEGAQRLVKRGHFNITDAHRRHLAAWQRRTDSVMEFLHDAEVCVLDEFELGLKCRRIDLYKGYGRWCIDAGRRAVGKQKFHETLETPTLAALGIRVVRTSVDREIVYGVWLRDGSDVF